MNDAPTVLHIALGESKRARQFVAELVEGVLRHSAPVPAGVITDANRALLRRATRYQAHQAQIRWTGRPRTDRRAVEDAFAGMSGLQPDLIHAHGLTSAPFADHLSRRLRVPWMLTVFGALPADWRSGRLLRRAARTVVLSERLRPKSGDLPVEVIPGAIDRREFSPAAIAESLMAELGLDPHTLHLGMVGQYDSEECGAFDFIEAASRIVKRIPQVEFVVIGDGSLLQSMQARAHQARALGNIRFLGPRFDHARLYHAMDTVVLPAHTSDFAWELLEAGAAGTPVLLTDIPAHREMLPTPDPRVTFYQPGDVDALERMLFTIINTPGSGLGRVFVDLAALGTGLSGTVLAEVSETQYAVGDEELEEVVDPDGPMSLRRVVYGMYEIGRIARRYAALYGHIIAMGQ